MIGRVAAGSPIMAQQHVEANYCIYPALFSAKPDWEADIRSGFKSTPHAIAFGDFSLETIRQYDLVVPLTVHDLRLLDGLRDAIGDRPSPLTGMGSRVL